MKRRSNFSKKRKLMHKAEKKENNDFFYLFSRENENSDLTFAIEFYELKKYEETHNVGLTARCKGSSSVYFDLGYVKDCRNSEVIKTLNDMFPENKLKNVKFDLQIFDKKDNSKIIGNVLDLASGYEPGKEEDPATVKSWIVIKLDPNLNSPYKITLSEDSKPTLYVSEKWVELSNIFKKRHNDLTISYVCFPLIAETVLLDYFMEINSGGEINKENIWFKKIMQFASKIYPPEDEELKSFLKDDNKNNIDMLIVKEWVSNFKEQFAMQNEYSKKFTRGFLNDEQ